MPGISPTNLYRLLSVADSAIALFVVFPFTCMYFRGIWDLIGYYILPSQAPLQFWVYVIIGQLQLPGLMILPYVDKLNRKRKVRFWILSRLFMYIYTIPYMFYWHGLWLLLDHYFGKDWQYSAGTLAFTYIIMCILGSCRSCMWPPFFISIDNQPDSFQVVNRFKSKFVAGSYQDYIADAYLAQMIILGMSICCWRSTFNIIEHFLSPEDPLRSDIIAAIVGVIGCAAMLCLQYPLGLISTHLGRKHRALKVVFEDVMYLITFGVLTFIWRGVWNLNCRYVMPRMPHGAWVNFVCGSVGLMGMHTFTEVCNFGITYDGMDPKGEAFYPIKYLRIFFRDRCDRGDVNSNVNKSTPDEKKGDGYENVPLKNNFPLDEKV